MVATTTTNPDSYAMLLLCAAFGASTSERVQSLTTAEFNRLARWLDDRSLTPASLLTSDGQEQLIEFQDDRIEPKRVLDLLQRGRALVVALDGWSNRGIWVLTRMDVNEYPERLTRPDRKRHAPAVIYGTGNRELLDEGGLAIVGSRDADERACKFAGTVAATCARQGIQVVSGGAKGIDSIAVTAALERGGSAVIVLAHGLESAVRSAHYRPYLIDQRLAIVSPYSPTAGFTTGLAMGRNKYIYHLADWALIVSAQREQGGTWEGAVENRRNDWTPLFVRAGTDIPDGNTRLLQQAALSFTEDAVSHSGGLREWIDQRLRQAPDELLVQVAPETQPLGEESDTPTSPLTQDPLRNATASTDAFDLLWENLCLQLAEPRTINDLAEMFNVLPAQMKAWMKRACELDRVLRLNRPVRYQLKTPPPLSPNQLAFGLNMD